jgi:hypothetical protein
METAHLWLEYKLLREHCLSTLLKFAKYGNEYRSNDQPAIKMKPEEKNDPPLPLEEGHRSLSFNNI